MTKYTQTIEVPLDMDKVPCYIGDIVYDETNEMYRIAGVEPLDFSLLVVCLYNTRNYRVINASFVTHKPFEDWATLEKDLNLDPYLYCKRNQLITEKEGGVMSMDRLRALKASDTIKRAQRIGD